ncbi:hypothetical protein [Nitrososphaera viennensis]|uniref:Uncharacterized protein n=2 Tax=Nitrososphaera viennensis TaxID=1034015 RepID=A0A060HIH1_9ARCH|nr:hypothetical protein [Nitrososphaera viennensis]AIC15328.1 hypothetical protein NVIE_010990 [Nitrososphaera viennensis EN76]UVS70228.1 hypothetical protein NWT39_05430 [Nitrososphaera viennensis]
MSGEQNRVEEAASAIEDLLYMGAIRLDGDRALLSPQFSLVASNVIDNMKVKADSPAEVMKLMYYSLLIYMNEYLKMPKALTMALGNDMENHRDAMESGALVTTYVAILSEIWSQNRHHA